MPHVRPAILAGSWYPGGRAELAAAIESFLQAGPPPSPAAAAGRPLLAIAPHAGYAYSGPTAGRLYKRLQGHAYDRVFILAPSHRAHLRRVSVPSYDAYATPLGEVPLDTAAAARLAESDGFESVDAAHAHEHAEEIQLPFLQTVFGEGLRIVPLLVPQLDEEDRRLAAAALGAWCDGRSLFLVSSDFTHYGASYGYVPFRDRVPERLEELDRGAIDRILARDPAGLLAYQQRTGITMCGIEAAALALSAPLPVAGAGELISYARSGDREGDYGLSVSYAALVLLARDAAGKAKAVAPARAPEPLDRQERRLLLALAREAVAAAAGGRRPPVPDEVAGRLGLEITPRLREARGAFVTLTSGGALRGCIGYIRGIAPLVDAVVDNAVSAASRDPRFRPVEPSELGRIHLEISALTPLRTVSGPAEIEIGRHGIVLAKGPAQAVFLPQVAPEQGWDRDTTLRHLAMKAGLDPDGWRSGARFQVFEAQVFGERESD